MNKNMIGLRVDNDRTHASLSQNKKSHKFAEKLTGRFFVSGVSGSLRKHRKLLDNELIHGERKYTYEPLLEKKQKDALKSEALALAEMEQKLTELRRRKELRKQRDETRARNRVIYTAACTIQRALVFHFKLQKSDAVDIILSFLR